MKLKLRSTLAIFASAIVFSGAVSAQKTYRTSNEYVDGVTIYEHCNFKGKSQTLRPGKYPSLSDIGFGNDSVSSIRVPRGVEAVIFQDDDYRGDYATIERDIRCFDRKWNDEASSISVRETEYRNRGTGNDQYNDQAYDRRESNRRSDGRNRNNSDQSYGRSNQNRNHRVDNNHQGQANVTAKNISQVSFDGISLQQVSTKQWSMDSKRGASKQFQEVRRDRDSVYLENKYTAERVRIDLFANDVTFISRDGRKQRYNIARKNAALSSQAETRPHSNPRPSIVKPVPSSSPSTRIPANCFNYKAYTKGGGGGLRFYGKDGFYQFNSKKAKTGRVCHQGPLTMEIGKTNPKTDVIVEINGKRFRFASDEKEDALLNTWYRKKVQLNVGH